MTEYFPGQISIGGELNPSNLDDFVAAVIDGGVSWTDDANGGEDSASLQTVIAQAIRDGTVLRLHDPEARYGGFSALETSCMSLGLSFVRYSAGKYECSPEVVWWTPGLDQPRSSPADYEAERPLLAADDLRVCLALPTTQQQLTALRSLLAENSPPRLPPLRLTAAVAISA